MDPKLKNNLIEIYQRYGFECARYYEQEQVLVFTLATGYFDNADLVPLTAASNTQTAFDEFTKSGFACTVRPVASAARAELQLFKGFFSVESILARLESDYKKFTRNIVSVYSDKAVYEYINAPYQINGREGIISPADEVINRIDSAKPTLFLIEAAAGFGKTCAAFELVHKLTQRGEYLPLFSELARNRQAVIFRHILLDEIDRTFPVLSSRLVQNEMKNGRVITILDGFDELLRKTDDGSDFENREPMLETIGEFLTGHAKIVLTTRRTVLFEGDAFHNWVEKHTNEFDLIRIKISEPRVADWLPEVRTSALKGAGLKIEDMANPVLLSYLRCISDAEFVDVASYPHALVEKYFDFMLDREKARQDLRMESATQQCILRTIAEDMVEFGYTSESRDYIVDQLERDNAKLLDDAILAYPPSERPTREELVNKLASHALLDRSVRESNKIGFVNEFVFGHFIAQAILNKDEWLNDDLRFIEPAVISYQPRSSDAKERLWRHLSPSVEFLPISDRLDITIRLRGEIDFAITDDEAHGLEMYDVVVGSRPITNFQFNECIFRNCTFDLGQMSNVTFLNCRYYGSSVSEGHSLGPIYELGGIGDEQVIDALIKSHIGPIEEIEPSRQLLLDRFVLEKFWPIGRETNLHKHRPIKGVCANGGEFKQHELYKAIVSLKRRGILLDPTQGAFVELNFDEMPTIREILGRAASSGK
jgi:hypothetical protein